MYKKPSANRRPSDAASNPLALAALPFSLLWYAPAGAALRDAKTIDGLGKIANEWLDFVHRRLDEDVRLARHVATSKSPAEAWGIYADFLVQGTRDYWTEFAALTRLASGAAGVTVDAAQDTPTTSASLQQAA